MGWNSLSIPKLQQWHRWSLGMDMWFQSILYNGCNYLSMLRLMSIHVSKRACIVLRNHICISIWHHFPTMKSSTCLTSTSSKTNGCNTIEPMLTDHQWSPVTFILGQFHKKCLNHQSLKSVWKLHVKISFKFPRGQWVNKTELCLVSTSHFALSATTGWAIGYRGDIYPLGRKLIQLNCPPCLHASQTLEF